MKKLNRKTKQYLHIITPALIIFIMAAISFSALFSLEAGKSFFVISLLIIYPVLFVYLGIYTAKNNIHVLFGLLPAYVSFAIVFFLWLNMSALIYFAIYAAAFGSGYGFILFDRSLDRKKENKEKKSRFYSSKKIK